MQCPGNLQKSTLKRKYFLGPISWHTRKHIYITVGLGPFYSFSQRSRNPWVNLHRVSAHRTVTARLVELRGRHLPPYPHPPHPHAAHIRMLLWHSPIVRSSKNLAPLANEYNRQKIGQQRHKTDHK